MQAARLELEDLLADRGIQLADEEMVRSYVEDLREVLANSSIPDLYPISSSSFLPVSITTN
ncbi:hypothetical protein ACFLVD_00540 [Chloroflexota bacterium]